MTILDQRSDAERALGEATRRFGPDILRSPVQTRAIVADLVGADGGDHRQQLRALHAAVEVLRDAPVNRADAVDQARALTDSPDVPWAVDLVAGRRGIVLERERVGGGGRRAVLVGGFVVLAIAVIAGAFVFFGPGGPSATTGTTTSVPTTSTTVPIPEFEAAFTPVREADFTVTRRWTAQGDSLRVTVRLDPVAGSGGGVHREALVGTGPIDAIVPTPQVPETDRVVVYEPSGTEPFEFSYRVSLPAPASAAELESLFNEWVPRRDAEISTVDAFEPVPPPAITAG